MAPADTDNEVLKAYLSNNKVSPKELPAVIAMFASLSSAPAKTGAKDSTAISTPKVPALAPVASVTTKQATGAAAGKAPVKAKKVSARAAAKARKLAAEERAAARAALKQQKTAARQAEMEARAAARKAARDEKAAQKAAAKLAQKAQKPGPTMPAPRGDNAPFMFEDPIATAALRKNSPAEVRMLGIRAANDPIVPISESVHRDYIVCLEDGKRLKMLKRHIRASWGFTPETYRAKWGLPDDYPMVADGYRQEKSKYAQFMGLGSTANKAKKHTTAAKLSMRAVRV
jgi:predicted transcriptional regulator